MKRREFQKLALTIPFFGLTTKLFGSTTKNCDYKLILRRKIDGELVERNFPCEDVNQLCLTIDKFCQAAEEAGGYPTFDNCEEVVVYDGNATNMPCDKYEWLMVIMHKETVLGPTCAGGNWPGYSDHLRKRYNIPNR